MNFLQKTYLELGSSYIESFYFFDGSYGIGTKPPVIPVLPEKCYQDGLIDLLPVCVETEVWLNDKYRCDILLDTHVVELKKGEYLLDAIGQVLNYARITERLPVIATFGEVDTDAIKTACSLNIAVIRIDRCYISPSKNNSSKNSNSTNNKKRKLVESFLRDEGWSQWSNRAIARQCQVSDRFVSKLRKELTGNVASDNSERTYINKHGQKSTMKTEKINRDRAVSQSKPELVTLNGCATK